MKNAPRIAVSVVTLTLTSSLVAAGAGCDVFAGDEGEGEGEGDLPGVDDAKDAVEDAVVEKLTCDERLRPSTLARLRAFLASADAETLGALLTNPADLASVVAVGGPQIEGGVLVARNLFALVADGTGADLVRSGWDGLLCGDAVPAQCTAGSATTVVSCDRLGRATAVRLDFDRCTLRGVVTDGVVDLDRDESDDSLARATFAGFTLNEVRALEGSLTVDVNVGADAFAAAVVDPDRFAFVEHGGLASGLECGSELDFAAFDVDVGADDTVVVFDGTRRTPEATLGMATTGEHLRFVDGCACPQPGSGLFVDVPRPLGQENQTARARIDWVAAVDDSVCATPRVTLSDWPTDCGALDALASGDCQKAASEDVLAGTLQALCAVD